MVIKVLKMFPDARLPRRATAGAIGYDVYAYHIVDKEHRNSTQPLPVTIEPGASLLFGIGVRFAIPFPVDCQVRPRSGLANKHNVELSNSPGTIDPDYRGEAGILLRNRGDQPFVVHAGDRIAQLIFTKVEIPHLEVVDNLPQTCRASGGFGSTGLQEIEEGDATWKAEQLAWDRYFLRMAVSAADLSNCLRGAGKDGDGRYIRDSEGQYLGSCRRFGCVIVKDRNVIGQGFNIRNSECTESAGCIREVEDIPSGEANDRGCFHAEEQALQNCLRTGSVSLIGATAYVNTEPCMKCAKLLMGCDISAIVVLKDQYPNHQLILMRDAGVEIRIVDLPEMRKSVLT